MNTHFTKLKKACPGTFMDIELTEDVRAKVFQNRVYKVEQVPNITQVINQNNTINNYIANMDTFTKLGHLIRYKNMEIQDFQDKAEECFERPVEKLKQLSQNSSKAPISLGRNQIFDMLLDMTKSTKSSLEDFNVFYDKEQERICFYMGSWENQQKTEGIKYLVDTLVSNYMDVYEVYLIRKLENINGSCTDKARLTSSLEDYYRFTSAFDIPPFVQGKSDHALYSMEGSDSDEPESHDIESHRIVDKYCSIYEQCKAALTISEKKDLHKAVLDIVKNSSKTNLRELNHRIMGIIKIDKDFGNMLLKSQ